MVKKWVVQTFELTKESVSKKRKEIRSRETRRGLEAKWTPHAINQCIVQIHSILEEAEAPMAIAALLIREAFRTGSEIVKMIGLIRGHVESQVVKYAGLSSPMTVNRLPQIKANHQRITESLTKIKLKSCSNRRTTRWLTYRISKLIANLSPSKTICKQSSCSHD